MKLSVPHWVIVALALIGAIAPQVGHAVPASADAMAIVSQLAILIASALGLVSGSALKSQQEPAILARHRADAAMKIIGPTSLALLLVGCTPGQGAAVATVAVDAGICALSTYADDVSKGASEVAIIEDIAVKCGLSAAQAQGILAAHRRAADAEMTRTKGFKP